MYRSWSTTLIICNLNMSKIPCCCYNHINKGKQGIYWNVKRGNALGSTTENDPVPFSVDRCRWRLTRGNGGYLLRWKTSKSAGLEWQDGKSIPHATYDTILYQTRSTTIPSQKKQWSRDLKASLDVFLMPKCNTVLGASKGPSHWQGGDVNKARTLSS